jgi:hypothetical protein
MRKKEKERRREEKVLSKENYRSRLLLELLFLEI